MVDICTTLGHYIIEVIKICLILSIFLIITGIILAIQYKQYIEDNWLKYRCSPLVFPFAGYFGHDSSETFSNCMLQVFTGFGGDMLAPIGFMTGQISGILKDFTGQIQDHRSFMNTFRNLHLTFVKGIMKRIEDGASTLQYLMTKMKSILERLYGILVTVIYVGFTSAETMTSVFKGPIGGFAKFFCFDGDSSVLMFNNKRKKMSDIKINDEVYLGGKVIGTLKLTSANNIMCNYKGVKVSITHLIKDNDTWRRLYDVKDKQIIRDYNKDYIYCLITENNLISINGCIFSDYIETSNYFINNEIKNIILSQLNNTYYKPIKPDTTCINIKKNYYCCGFDGDSLIRMKEGNKKLKDINIGDLTFDDKKILGKIKQKPTNQDVCILNNVILSDCNIIFHNNEWKEIKNIQDKIYINYSDILYNICVEDNIFQIGDLLFRDYEETEDKETCIMCDDYVVSYLNTK